MNRRRLESLRRKAESYRHSQPKAKELNTLAKGLGRKQSNRGKESTFVNKEFPSLRPLSIPNHKGRDLPSGTRNSILVQLEEDFIAWDDRLSEQGRLNGDGGKGG